MLRNGYALPHPNCRHEFIPWFEEMEEANEVEKTIRASKIKYDNKGNLVDVRYQKDIESYQAWQAGNRQLNRELLEYEQMRAHYGENAPYKTLAGFRRASRAKSEDFLRVKEVLSENNVAVKIKSQEEKKGSQQSSHLFITNGLGKASSVLYQHFAIKSTDIIITDKQYKTHIAQGANTHGDIFEEIKDDIPTIIEDPDYVFKSNKREDTVIYVSMQFKAQLIIKLNTVNKNLSNTIITIFGCGKSTLKRLIKKNEKLYQKSIDKK